MPLTEQRNPGKDICRQAGVNDDCGISEEETVRVAEKLYRLFRKDDPEAFLGNFDLRGSRGIPAELVDESDIDMLERTVIDGNFRLKRIAKAIIMFIRRAA
jgi:hypothetical protein